MFTHYSKLGAAALSVVTASLLIATAALAAQEHKPVVVYADPQEGVRTERVSYADLDLSKRPGERALNGRVARAVKRVCLFEGHSANQGFGYYDCADQAWDGARPQIARAVIRAREIALTGKSSIAASAISITVGQ